MHILRCGVLGLSCPSLAGRCETLKERSVNHVEIRLNIKAPHRTFRNGPLNVGEGLMNPGPSAFNLGRPVFRTGVPAFNV
jgi:hypothetical protein